MGAVICLLLWIASSVAFAVIWWWMRNVSE
jgi:hypothetical protein